MNIIRKISLLVAASVTVCLLFTACNSNDTTAPMGFKEISDDGVSYDLFVPDEWTADISTGMTAAYYSGIDTSNISMTAFELTDNKILSAKDYWATYEPELRAMFTDLSYVGEPDEITLDEAPSTQYIYTGALAGVQYKIMQIITVRNAQVYIFTYTAKVDNYDAHIEDVLAILGNFRFK